MALEVVLPLKKIFSVQKCFGSVEKGSMDTKAGFVSTYSRLNGRALVLVVRTSARANSDAKWITTWSRLASVGSVAIFFSIEKHPPIFKFQTLASDNPD
jgi:hypothetical protein